MSQANNATHRQRNVSELLTNFIRLLSVSRLLIRECDGFKSSNFELSFHLHFCVSDFRLVKPLWKYSNFSLVMRWKHKCEVMWSFCRGRVVSDPIKVRGLTFICCLIFYANSFWNNSRPETTSSEFSFKIFTNPWLSSSTFEQADPKRLPSVLLNVNLTSMSLFNCHTSDAQLLFLNL